MRTFSQASVKYLNLSNNNIKRINDIESMIEFNSRLQILIISKNPVNELINVRQVLHKRLKNLFLINHTPINLIDKGFEASSKYRSRISNMQFKIDIKYKSNVDNLISVDSSQIQLKELNNIFGRIKHPSYVTFK